MKRYYVILQLVLLVAMILVGCSNHNHSFVTSETMTITANKNEYETVSSAESNGYQQLIEVPEGYIGIYTVEDLINSDKNQEANYILMNDLDLSDIDNWRGLVNRGIFNGNNYTISNFTALNIGLFLSANEISNLNIENINISITEILMDSYIGCLSSVANNINSCTVKGNIRYELNSNLESNISTMNYEYNIGGVVGKINDSISDCESDINITIAGNGINAGGILCETNGNVTNCHSQVNINAIGESTIIGGILGIAKDGAQIEYCNVQGNIEANGTIGGVCATVEQRNILINGCSCSCDIAITDNSENGILVGGILGNAGYSTTVENSSSTGIIEDNGVHKYLSCIGGIVGDGYDEICIRNSFHSGELKIKSVETSNYNIGSITAYTHSSGLTIYNCAYLKNEYGITPTGAMFSNCYSLTNEELKDISNYPFDNINMWENTVQYPVYVN